MTKPVRVRKIFAVLHNCIPEGMRSAGQLLMDAATLNELLELSDPSDWKGHGDLSIDDPYGLDSELEIPIQSSTGLGYVETDIAMRDNGWKLVWSEQCVKEVFGEESDSVWYEPRSTNYWLEKFA